MVSITRSMFTSTQSVIELGSTKGRKSALELMVSGKAYLIFDDDDDEKEKEKEDERSREFIDFHKMDEHFPPVHKRKKSRPNFKVKLGA